MASRWYCPNCLKDIPAESKGCPHCGLKFGLDSDYYVSLGTMISIARTLELGWLDHEVSCPMCEGTGRAFCPSCGNANYAGGTSVRRDVWDVYGGWRKCTTCDGWGYGHGSCKSCDGKGKLPARVARRTKHHIPKRVP